MAGAFRVIAAIGVGIYRVTQIFMGYKRIDSGIKRIKDENGDSITKAHGIFEIVLGAGTMVGAGGELLDKAHVLEPGPILDVANHIMGVAMIYEAGSHGIKTLDKYYKDRHTTPPSQRHVMYLILMIDSFKTIALAGAGGATLLENFDWGRLILNYLPKVLPEGVLEGLTEEDCTSLACRLLNDAKTLFASTSIVISDFKEVVQKISKKEFQASFVQAVLSIKRRLQSMVGIEPALSISAAEPDIETGGSASGTNPFSVVSMTNLLKEQHNAAIEGLRNITAVNEDLNAHIVTNIQMESMLKTIIREEVLPTLVAHSEIPEKRYVCSLCQKHFVQDPDSTNVIIKTKMFIESKCFVAYDQLPDGSALTRKDVRKLTEGEKSEIKNFNRCCIPMVQISLNLVVQQFMQRAV